MPVVFVHGVNTREDDDGYYDGVEARKALVRRIVLEPLGPPFAAMKLVDAYWGKHGVRFRWNLASVPTVGVRDVYGQEELDVDEGELVFAATVEALSGEDGALDAGFRDDGVLREAAAADLRVFLETVLAPVLIADTRLSDGTAEEEGIQQATLAIALDAVAESAEAQAAVSETSSDDELMEVLEEKVATTFESLLPPAGNPELDTYGPLSEARERIGELFARARSAPARAPSVAGLALWRDRAHERMSRFLGDIFVYLNERGDEKKPGPIVKAVLESIEYAVESAPKGEPLVVITHSMGGNIVYDLLTHYAPTLEVDFWASVGGQVAQFEEMKLFRDSKQEIGTPQRISGLKPRLKYWINIFDPADVFGFRAEPVFGDEVDADIPYSTGAGGMKAHGEYFGRASFYRLLRTHLEAAKRANRL